MNSHAQSNGSKNGHKSSVIKKLIDSGSLIKNAKKIDEIILKPFSGSNCYKFTYLPFLKDGFNFWLKVSDTKFKIVNDIISSLFEGWHM